jgi:hypothetical protein
MDGEGRQLWKESLDQPVGFVGKPAMTTREGIGVWIEQYTYLNDRSEVLLVEAGRCVLGQVVSMW